MACSQLLTDGTGNFDKTPTLPILAFELVVATATLMTLVVLSRVTPRIRLHFITICIGVLIFEVFTAPMWNNYKLGPWGYLYQDVSWVLTIGWATMITIAVFLVDWRFPHWKEWQRFLLYLLLLTPTALVAEAVVVLLGIRSYAPEVLARIAGASLPVLEVGAAGLYYIPVFMTLTISFYKYWVPIIEGTRLPEVQGGLLRRFVLAFIGVFFFEIMIEPLVNNHHFPQWSYVLYDISIVLTLLWVAVLAVGTYGVDLALRRKVGPRLTFATYLLVIGAVALPIEAWSIVSGLREYGPSATANFSGFRVVIGDIPIEVAFAIPLYLSLVITFVRYWERIGSYRSSFSRVPHATMQPAAGEAD